MASAPPVPPHPYSPASSRPNPHQQHQQYPNLNPGPSPPLPPLPADLRTQTQRYNTPSPYEYAESPPHFENLMITPRPHRLNPSIPANLISTLFLVFIAIRIYISLSNAVRALTRAWGLGYRDTVHATSARSGAGTVDDRSSSKKERKRSQSRIPSIDIARSDNLQKAAKPIAASASQPSPTSTPEAGSQNGIGHTTPHDCVPPLPTHCCCHSHMCVPHTSNASTNGNHEGVPSRCRDAIHLQFCIDNSRTLITGSNFRSVVGVSQSAPGPD